MKYSVFLTMFFLSQLGLCQESKVIYNDSLAKTLGADEYGMKSYFLVILKTGDTKIEDKTEVNQIFRAHLDNITKYANLKKLVVAGPLQPNDNNYRGIFIFDVSDKSEVETILMEDMAILKGLLKPEIYNWYGSAALIKYMDTHQLIQKNKI